VDMNLEAGWSVAQDFKEDERGVCEQHPWAEKLQRPVCTSLGVGKESSGVYFPAGF
jgi:hypothetical protein